MIEKHKQFKIFISFYCESNLETKGMIPINKPLENFDRGQICSRQIQLFSSTAEYNEERQPEKTIPVAKPK